MIFKLSFLTFYGQFYICDKGSPSATDDDSFWTDDAVQARLAIGEGILGVSIANNSEFNGEFELRTEEVNEIEFSNFDHVVEAGLEVTSGTLQVLGCPHSNMELETAVIPGPYRIRICSSNLNSDKNEDHYRIVIWPSNNLRLKVLKQFAL